MTKGKLIAGIAAGAVVALFSIPKTRKLIIETISSFADSIMQLAGKEVEATERRLTTS
jgi:peptidase E